MIDCAIYIGGARKRELLLTSPVLIAAGAMGYGPIDFGLMRREHIGAFVTPPLTWQPRPVSEPPRLARTAAGYLIHTGRANPGLRAAMRCYAKHWAALELPVIVALHGRTPEEYACMAEFLAASECVQGIELDLPPRMAINDIMACIRATIAEVALPCLVRLPFHDAPAFALAAQEVGADALVACAPPFGRALGEEGRWVCGPLHSPALLPLYAEILHQVAAVARVPVIGRGGIADMQDALTLISAGAVAVQLDSILCVYPTACSDIYLGLEQYMTHAGVANWTELLSTRWNTQVSP